MRQLNGFTVVEIAVLIVLLAVTAAVIVILAPEQGPDYGPRFDELDARIGELRSRLADLEQRQRDETVVREIREIREELEPLLQMTRGMQRTTDRKRSSRGRKGAECMDHVRLLTNLLNIMMPNRYPDHSGANLILYLVKKGEIGLDEKRLQCLFCPTDARESLEAAGGVDSYRNLKLDHAGGHGHLTSYAGRDLSGYPAKPGQSKAVVIVADDSADHHQGLGVVVGLSDGTVHWREFKSDYGVEMAEVGPDSKVPELACLRAD
jgi:hypothetical protein